MSNKLRGEEAAERQEAKLTRNAEDWRKDRERALFILVQAHAAADEAMRSISLALHACQEGEDAPQHPSESANVGVTLRATLRELALAHQKVSLVVRKP